LICVAFLATPASAGAKHGPVVVIPVLDVDGELVMHWLDVLFHGSQSDLRSRYGAEDPPKGANKPVTKSRWGADDPPKGANKPITKSRWGADGPPGGANKPVTKSKYGSTNDPPKGANKPAV
jgi:hypothetical protein